MKLLKGLAARLLLGWAFVAGPSVAHAGIPVIDLANLAQAVQEVLSSITQIQNQISQIRQLQAQYEAISGSRNLGAILNNPLLQDYVPRDAVQVIRTIEADGYGGLQGAGKALRDARMVYNCMDLDGVERARCQAALSRPYQSKAWLEEAMERAGARTAQINALMGQINATADQKAILELQGRLQAENALLQHEATQISLARGIAEAEVQVAAARAREGQLEQQSRTGRLGDFMAR